MTRTYRPYDKRSPIIADPVAENRAEYVLNQHTGALEPFVCLKCGAPLFHREAYSHALYTCPNRKR